MKFRKWPWFPPSKRRTLFFFCLLVITMVYITYFIYTIIPSFFGDSFGEAMAWVDSNGNGIQDVGESPLMGVCVWADSRPSMYNADQTENICATSYNHTDKNGRWARFFAGGYCRNIYIFAKSPKGYQPTTSLGGNGCTVEFGFVPEGTLEKTNVLSPAEFAQPIIRTQTINTWMQLGFLSTLIVLAAIVSIKLTPIPKKPK